MDALEGVDFLAPPLAGPGRAYAGARTATLRGPAGELVELIEEAPPPAAGKP
jgi:hypothetical protein